MIPLLVLFFAQSEPKKTFTPQEIEIARKIFLSRNDKIFLIGRKIIENPATIDQFQANLILKFGMLDDEKVTQLFQAYLGQREWPKFKPLTKEVASSPNGLRILLNAGRKRQLLPNENELMEKIKDCLAPTKEEIQAQKDLVARMEKGRVISGGRGEVSDTKNGFLFGSSKAKADFVKLEKTILEAMENAPEPVKLVVPRSAKTECKTIADYRQSQQDAEFWYLYSYAIPFFPVTLQLDLQENLGQKIIMYAKAKALLPEGINKP